MEWLFLSIHIESIKYLEKYSIRFCRFIPFTCFLYDKLSERLTKNTQQKKNKIIINVCEIKLCIWFIYRCLVYVCLVIFSNRSIGDEDESRYFIFGILN